MKFAQVSRVGFIASLILFGSIGSKALAGSINVLYPEDYGAKGDDTVDDGAAINRAIAAAKAGDTVWLSLPQYYLQTPIQVSNGVRLEYSNMPEIKPSVAHTPATQGVIYSANGNVKTSLPIVSGFSNVGVEINNAGVINMDIHWIQNCGSGLQLSTSSGGGTGTNTIRVQWMSGCTYGVHMTSDGSAGCVMQGNQVYTNFFDAGTQAVVWDNVANPPAWDGNTFDFGSVDCAGASGSGVFINNSSAPVYNNILAVENWMGGISQSNGYYIKGQFSSCEFKLRGDSGMTSYGTYNFSGNGNRFIDVGGGGYLNAGYAALQTTANNRSAFGGPFAHNREEIGLVLPSSIAPGAQVTFYAYSPWTDGNSNTLNAIPTTPIGLVLESAADNSASHANEIKLTFRNASGSTISSGTIFHAILVIGL